MPQLGLGYPLAGTGVPPPTQGTWDQRLGRDILRMQSVKSSGGFRGCAGPKFLKFNRVFQKILLKYWVGAPPLGIGAPLLGEVLDPPLKRQHGFQHFDRCCLIHCYKIVYILFVTKYQEV